MTRVMDIFDILALALESEEPWLTVCGMRKVCTLINGILALGRKIRGGE